MKFEGKNNIQAQIRELEIKDAELEARLQTTTNNSIKTLIQNLIEANITRIRFLREELEELHDFDQLQLTFETTPLPAELIVEFEQSEAYYDYVIKRQKLDNDEVLLGDLIFENEQLMLKLDQSLRQTLNKETLTKEQYNYIKRLEKVQSGIAYLKAKLGNEINELSSIEKTSSYEFLYQNKINPVASDGAGILSENDTQSLNKVLLTLGQKLQAEQAEISPNTLNSKSFITYNQKRMVQDRSMAN